MTASSTEIAGGGPADAGHRGDGAPVAGHGARRAGTPRGLGGVVTALAGLLVLGALLLPDEPGGLTPGAFVRLPIEALLLVALLLVLPARARRIASLVAGVALGLLAVLKLLDLGFGLSLARPFDPVLDWGLFDDAARFLTGAIGVTGAVVVAIVAALAAVGALAVLVGAVLRLVRAMAGHRRATARAVAVLAVAWVACAALGAQLVPGVPVADRSASGILADRAVLVAERLRDPQVFAAESAVDAFRDNPPERLLTALRGKDVAFVFVESYGRSAVEDPRIDVGDVLADGDRRLAAAGFAARSGYLTSSTAGGGSWLAHATFLSGLWIDNQQRYDTLLAGDRLTLGGAFRAAGWRTVGVMPGTTSPWPDGARFYGYDRIYDFGSLGYRGPSFSWATVPDQYTLEAFERTERDTAGRAPVMAEVALVSSHAPWSPLPRPVPWDALGDGSVFAGTSAPGDPTEVIFDRDAARVRADYRASIEYSLGTLVSYVETHGDDNLVLVVLGDHQPSPVVTGWGASRDVPITIVARDRAVLDRISGWGWTDGLKPAPTAPVWRMDTFRNRFLTAFGS